MQEKWRPIDGYPYQVSSLGRVRKADGTLVRQTIHNHGYVRVWIRSQTDAKHEYVHRLVARAFIGPPPAADSHADHINGKRDDNRLVNIRWLDPSANRATRRIAYGVHHWHAKLTPAKVRKIRTMTGTHAAIALKIGISRRQVGDIKRGIAWKQVT